MESLVTVREGFPDRLKDFFHSSEGDLFTTGNGLLRWDITAAPRALNRATSAQGEMIDRRFQRIHPEILLFGDAFHIEGLPDKTNISGVIL